jgi:hypothetical protein
MTINWLAVLAIVIVTITILGWRIVCVIPKRNNGLSNTTKRQRSHPPHIMVLLGSGTLPDVFILAMLTVRRSYRRNATLT